MYRINKHNAKSTRTPIAAAIALALGLAQAISVHASIECDTTRCVLEVHKNLTFEADLSNTSEHASEIEMTGTVDVRGPMGTITLGEAELVFTPRPDLEEVAFELYGTAAVPLPSMPLFEVATIHAQPRAALGIATRETLRALLDADDFQLPLAENPSDPEDPNSELIEPAYLFFHFDSGLDFDMPLGEWLGFNQSEGAHDPFSFQVPGDKNVTFIVDPSEPYFFLSSDARELVAEKASEARVFIEAMNEQNEENANYEADNSVSSSQTSNDGSESSSSENTEAEQDKTGSAFPDVAEIAFSWLGGIPFEPTTTWGLPDDIGHFKGNLYVDLSFPLSPFVTISGPVVTRVDGSGFEVGGNGDVAVAIGSDWLPGIEFGFPLGAASAGVKLSTDQQYSYFSGINSPDYSFLPPQIPFWPQNETRVAGVVDSEQLENSRIRAYGQFGYDTTGLSNLVGVDLSNLVANETYLSIDKAGFRALGTTSSSIHPSIALGAEVSVDIFFSPQSASSSYIEMRGNMDLGGVGLDDVRLRADANGLLASGNFVTPLTAIGMTGEIGATGPRLSGNAAIIFPLGDVNALLDAAREDLRKAQDDVQKLEVVIAAARATVQSERQVHAAKLADAEAKLNIARQHVASLESQISSSYRTISANNRAISAKYRWYRAQKWYRKSWAWAKYAAYRASKTASNSWHYTRIGSLKAAKAVADVTLKVSAGAVAALRTGSAAIPVDLDPRVAGPLASLEVAQATLSALEKSLPQLPRFDADIAGEISLSLDHTGLSGTVAATANGTSLADGFLELGENPKACIQIATVGQVCAPF